MIFLLSDGSTVLAKDYLSPTSAQVVMIGVAVAVIDDHVMTQLQPTTSGNFKHIQDLLEQTLTNNNFAQMKVPMGSTTYVSTTNLRSIKELWDADPAVVALDQAAGYPKSLAAGFQTFERFVPCTPFN
jgi:hypothetical protein